MFVPWELPQFSLDINNLLLLLVNTHAVIKWGRHTVTEERMAITMCKKNGTDEWEVEKRQRAKGCVNKMLSFHLSIKCFVVIIKFLSILIQF